MKPKWFPVARGRTIKPVSSVIIMSTPKAKLLVTQARPLGGRIVPRDFLPVAGITIGCLNDVVDLTDDRVPVCRSGRRRVTAGDSL